MEWIDIILVVLCAAIYAVLLYFKVRGNVLGAVSELIALAETTGLTGSEKMAQVVHGLSEKVPAPLKKVLNDQCLENIAQRVFDWMRRYADEYAKTIPQQDTETAQKEAAVEIGAEATAELISELLNLTTSRLKEKAKDYGIALDGLTTKNEIVRAIIMGILNKA
jgi:arginyl-tRNA synthetase